MVEIKAMTLGYLLKVSNTALNFDSDPFQLLLIHAGSFPGGVHGIRQFGMDVLEQNLGYLSVDVLEAGAF